MRALASSNSKSCKDHVDDSHPIDLYTFISVNIGDGSFHVYGTPYTYCKPQNLGYECSSFSVTLLLLAFLNHFLFVCCCATTKLYVYRVHRAQVSYDKINAVDSNINETI